VVSLLVLRGSFLPQSNPQILVGHICFITSFSFTYISVFTSGSTFITLPYAFVTQDVFRFSLLSFLQVIAMRDIIRPPKMEAFNDVYIVYELMDTDFHQIIRSEQSLNDDHCQVWHQEQCFGFISCNCFSVKLDSLSKFLLVVSLDFLIT
jgi:hypothetical protein